MEICKQAVSEGWFDTLANPQPVVMKNYTTKRNSERKMKASDMYDMTPGLLTCRTSEELNVQEKP